MLLFANIGTKKRAPRKKRYSSLYYLAALRESSDKKSANHTSNK